MAEPHNLLQWYEGLSARTVDLVGDYAGDELFFIEGDSLLLSSFSDETLDFSNGLQLLHATYIVEKFLAALLQRKCNFHVIFFAQHAALCIPPSTPVELHASYLLAREAIIQHLQYNLSLVVPSVKITLFDTFSSPDFQQHLASSGAYFFMCHDGAFPRTDTGDDEDDETGSDESGSQTGLNGNDPPGRGRNTSDKNIVKELGSQHCQKKAMRSMIHWFICRGYNVALIHSVEYRDTKVMAMIVEDSALKSRPSLYMQDLPQQVPDDPSAVTEASLEVESTNPQNQVGQTERNDEQKPTTPHRQEETNSRPPQAQFFEELLTVPNGTPVTGLTQRDLLIVATLSSMFKTGTIGTDSLPEARAMLMHLALLQDCLLSDRVVGSIYCPKGIQFLEKFVENALLVLVSEAWRMSAVVQERRCDLADLIDGRLFLHILSQPQQPGVEYAVGRSLSSSFELLASLVDGHSGTNLRLEPETQRIQLDLSSSRTVGSNGKAHATQGKKSAEKNDEYKIATAVLPFSNPVFDIHLSPVHLVIERNPNENDTSRIFKELTHWHNHKRPIDRKVVIALADWEKKRNERRNQRFMTEMRDYAASLTNAVGGVLEPETIIATSSKGRLQKLAADSAVTENVLTKSKPKILPQGATKATSKNKIKEIALAATLQKQNEVVTRQIQAWTVKIAEFDREGNLSTRLVMVKGYLNSLSKTKRTTVEAEILTYLLSILIQMWMKDCAKKDCMAGLPTAALVWDMVLQIRKLKQGITAEIATCVAGTVQTPCLPASQPLNMQDQRPLSFRFVDLRSPKTNLGVQLPPLEFQLVHAGPFLDRNIGSTPDPRVHDFEPDEWQRKVLDQIDAKNSIFVVAPTSAGKTFISFYAMKQVLEEDDNGVLVYVAPTKALVNQIAAEVQARFSKSFNLGGKSVWGIYTRDHRVNNPTGCQVLVTVPHILQIMLLAPGNASSWSSRVKRIIFDEVHCIGQAEDGVIWEQLLLLVPCPIIALSATVGNPREFSAWLGRAQEANGIHLEMIEHRHRYSDLRKYVYSPPQKFVFNGFSVSSKLPSVGLQAAIGITFMHPIASLMDRSRGMPDDFSLEPRDCWTLWKTMKMYQTKDFPVDEFLDPSNYLPEVVRKADVVEWEGKLKTLLQTWIKDHKSPFDMVLRELEHPVRNAIRPELQVSSGKLLDCESPGSIHEGDCLDTTLPLICSLHDQGALPALFFNYDRSRCELLCQRVLNELKEAEAHWKDSSPEWKAQINKWEAWKRNQEKKARKKAPKKTKKGQMDDEATTRAERMRDVASEETSPYESFDPEEPVNGFHLADTQKLPRSELQKYVKQLIDRELPQWQIDALRRGIGVHHAGLNRKYRQVCEILFRKGYLRVVIATGTLALGINMPCKTVVFSGDSIYLTALNFRQSAGRAGRRGFDVLGNVVFQGVPYSKICRLMSSRLPDLNGHFPITTTLVLRLFALLHESKRAAYAVKAINSILSCPRIYLGGPESKHAVLHHLRFSIEYLRRNHLLDASGAPLNFAGCVSHLYYTENSSFAFHALLKGGYFSHVCGELDGNPKKVLLTLILVLSHLFGRQNLRQSVLESRRATTKAWSSLVILPRLPNAAARILQAHNDQTRDIYAAYVSTFIDQHVHETDNILPLTGMKCGGDKSSEEIGPLISPLRRVRVNSAFVALSGHRDSWKSVSSLCRMVRSGVWLEEAVIPFVGLDDGTGALNAYLYDFFNHGNVAALGQENGIRKGEVWFVLNDFSMILATIVTSLENFLKLSRADGADMLEIMGSGEMRDAEVEDRLLEDESPDKETSNSSVPLREKTSQSLGPAKTSTHAPAVRQKNKVADSWDDELSDDTASTGGEDAGEANETAAPQTMGADDGVGSVGLGERELLSVLKAFRMLQVEFDQKFRKMWA